MKKTGVIVAMQEELEAVRNLGLPGIVPVLSGIGKVNAARAATELILREDVKAIVNFGMAGALAEDLRTGDVVLGARVAYHDVWCGEGNAPGQVQGEPLFFDADPVLLRKASQSCGESVREGLIASGDQFFISTDEDARIRALYPDALASDMESGAVAQVCSHYAVPFLAVRIISDLHTSEALQAETWAAFSAALPGMRVDVLKKCLLW